MSTHTETPVRVCSDCARIQPATCFRKVRRDGNSRATICNGCHASRERIRLARRRQKRRHMEIQKFATAYCRTRNQRRRELLLDAALHQAGGFPQFLKDWLEMISTMMEKKQHSPRLLRLYELIWELQKERRERKASELETMSDSELEAFLEAQIVGLVKENPQLAVDAAAKLGWNLSPAAAPSGR